MNDNRIYIENTDVRNEYLTNIPSIKELKKMKLNCDFIQFMVNVKLGIYYSTPSQQELTETLWGTVCWNDPESLMVGVKINTAPKYRSLHGLGKNSVVILEYKHIVKIL